jgi:hypothetical protein
MTLLAFHIFAFALLAKPSVATPPVPVDLYQLGREVTLLAQLAPLHLTEKQVKGILALYRDSGRLALPDAPIVDQLTQMRQHFLVGDSVAAKDVQAVVAALPQDARMMRGGGGGRGGPAPNEMVDKSLALLEEWQQAILANRTDTLQQIITRRAGTPTADATRVFLAIAAVPNEQWATQRTHLADRVAAAVEEKQRKQVCDALLDFLDRIHGMNEVQVRTQADELWQNIVALFPPELPVLSLLQDVDPQNLRRRAAPLFLDPMTPDVLREMATVRGWHVD